MIAFNLFEALIITEIVEVIAAFLLGYREKRFFKALILINIITNPVLNCILIILYNVGIHNFIITPILEAVVVICEWKLFKFVLGNSERSLLFLSLIINLSSYTAGLLLF